MTTNATPAATKKIVAKNLPTGQIDRDPNQPREHFDQTKLEELASSMKALGQLQPIAVRPTGADEKGRQRYTIIMGERRWRAAQIAGLTEMKTLIHYGIEDGDPQTLAKAVAENVSRADMTPIEEAKGFQRLTDLGYTIADIASMCGKSEAYIGWRIDLLKLELPLQEALMKEHIPVGLAWFVANLSGDNQKRFLTRYVRGDFASARDAEAFARACAAEEERLAKQGSLFVLAEDAPRAAGGGGQEVLLDMPVEERDRIAADRKKLVGKIEGLDKAGEILSEIAAMDAGELALLLAGAQGGLGAQKLRIDHLKDVAGKAAKKLREAQAAATVRASALQVSPDAVPTTGEPAA
ncbi:ParB/RepB/Spo0J family partition protein [Sphaerisporangium sp. NPDC051011]|uniref:ParB/RepB/Spo0J family partition protein n=1 Tax=Sphaerisporangium sp. NPDC051011 TaxID=3155792 RepID=UPI0033D9F8A5